MTLLPSCGHHVFRVKQDQIVCLLLVVMRNTANSRKPKPLSLGGIQTFKRIANKWYNGILDGKV